MDPHGLRVFVYFILIWVTFWATAGGFVCRSLGRPAWKGIVLGGILAPIGILLALLLHENKPAPVRDEVDGV